MPSLFYFVSLLLALNTADVLYVSVRDESFGFMRDPQTLTTKAVIKGGDPRIAALVRDLARPALAAPEPENLKIDLGSRSLKDLQAAYFHGYFADSADRIVVRMHLRDSGTVSIISNSQMPWMLPWVTYGLHDPQITYDARLSRAIALLLPLSTPSRDLLAGRGDMGWPNESADIDPKKIYQAQGLGENCLAEYTRDHPGVTETIHIEGNLSLSFRSQQRFLADQYRAGRADIVDEVAGQLQVYSWVTLRGHGSQTDWVVGPNNLPTILWRHLGHELLGADTPVVSGFMDISRCL